MAYDVLGKVPAQPMLSVDPEVVDKAASAVTDLIVAVLKSSSKARFAEASRLCGLGQTLARIQCRTVDDFVEQEQAHPIDGGCGWDNGNVGAFPRIGPNVAYQGVAYQGPIDQNELTRHAMLAIGPLAEVQRLNGSASIAQNEASELETLLLMEAKLPEAARPTVRTRIENLIKSMEARNARTDAPDSLPKVVSPVLSRGHSPLDGAVGRRAEDEPPRLRADEDRGGGDPATSEARQRAVDGEGVGNEV